jgi:hypothetical protein
VAVDDGERSRRQFWAHHTPHTRSQAIDDRRDDGTYAVKYRIDDDFEQMVSRPAPPPQPRGDG